MKDLGLCFGAKRCQICGRDFENGEARYEVDGIGCVCWDCYERMEVEG